MALSVRNHSAIAIPRFEGFRARYDGTAGMSLMLLEVVMEDQLVKGRHPMLR